MCRKLRKHLTSTVFNCIFLLVMKTVSLSREQYCCTAVRPNSRERNYSTWVTSFPLMNVLLVLSMLFILTGNTTAFGEGQATMARTMVLAGKQNSLQY